MRIKICLFFILALGFSYTPNVLLAANEAESANVNKTDRYIRFVYEKIKFPKNGKIKYEAFKNGFYGYLNLLEAGKITRNATLSICDFTLSSNVKRMWVIDVRSKKVLFHTLVAHGMGTGEEYAVNFSNIEESHQSSLGFYTTAETYTGNNGYSLKLNGVDGIYNNKAYDRAIVIHGAEYVSEEFAKANQRLGRSHGCPALPTVLAPKIIDQIKNNQCLFIYHSNKQYLKTSYWLNNKIQQLPDESELMDLKIPNNPRFVVQPEIKTEDKTEDKVVSPKSKETASLDELETPKSRKYVDEDGMRVETTTTIIKKSEIQNPEKKPSTIILIQENRNGTMDTSIVK